MIPTPPVPLLSAATARHSLPTGSGAGSMLLGVPRSASLLPEKGVNGGKASEAEQGQKHENRKRKRADKTTAEEHEDTCVPSCMQKAGVKISKADLDAALPNAKKARHDGHGDDSGSSCDGSYGWGTVHIAARQKKISCVRLRQRSDLPKRPFELNDLVPPDSGILPKYIFVSGNLQRYGCALPRPCILGEGSGAFIMPHCLCGVPAPDFMHSRASVLQVLHAT